jgi:hypothetical protein
LKPRSTTFAFPYGEASPAAKQALSDRFRALRGFALASIATARIARCCSPFRWMAARPA